MREMSLKNENGCSRYGSAAQRRVVCASRRACGEDLTTRDCYSREVEAAQTILRLGQGEVSERVTWLRIGEEDARQKVGSWRTKLISCGRSSQGLEPPGW